MTHFLRQNDPVFQMLLEELREANNIYHALKTEPITPADLFLFRVTLQNLYNFITDAICAVHDWKQGSYRATELLRIKHDIKEVEELIFESQQRQEVAFNTHSDRFVAASSKIKALFNLDAPYPFHEY